MSEKRLYRSVHGRVIGGVAGGLADFFDMDPTIVRLIFVLLFVFGGSGLLFYVILWIVVPEKDKYINRFSSNVPPESGTSDPNSGIGETYEGYNQQQQDSYAATQQENTPSGKSKKIDGGLVGGLTLILIGSMFLLERFTRIRFGDLWPIVLVAIGLFMIFGNLSGRNNKKQDPEVFADKNDENDVQTF